MIQMKKQLLSAALVAAFSSALAINANAADITKGKITFEGKVVEQTCTISNNNENQTVKLKNVSKNALAQKYATAMPTQFFIHLNNCTVGQGAGANNAVRVKAGFSSVDNIDVANEYTLANKAQTNKADKVNIRLFNKDGTTAISPMKITTSVSDGVLKQIDEDNVKPEDITTSTTLTYIAKYYATDVGVTSGDVKTSVDFELVYE
ncbi:type 1 fimbrial protein [Haemophilus influenzae biotype aegyptius]|nr:Major fimbrial subunit precursor [Haemophilus influenzae]QEQ59943.1 type 1 fimbrial protein [Haemophilus influenzae biotype aegyptius]